MRSSIPGLALAALVGCGGGGGGPDAGACVDSASADYACAASPQAVSTATVHAQVIAPDCNVTCHKPSDAASISYGDFSDAAKFQSAAVGKVSLLAGSAKSLKVVDTGSLQNSTLWLKLLGGAPAGKKGPNCEGSGTAMPNGTAPLSSQKLALIKDWICSGAKP